MRDIVFDPVASLVRGTPAEPITVVFTGNASAQHVNTMLMSLPGAPGTGDRWQRRHLIFNLVRAFIDDTGHDGTAGWVLPSTHLTLGPATMGTRFHMRLFESLVPHSRTGMHWCIATLHREQWIPLAPGQGTFDQGWHIINDWMEGQRILSHMLTNSSPDLQVESWPLSNAGWYQGHWFDGQVTHIHMD